MSPLLALALSVAAAGSAATAAPAAADPPPAAVWLEATPLAGEVPPRLYWTAPGRPVVLRDAAAGRSVVCTGGTEQAVSCREHELVEGASVSPAPERGVELTGVVRLDREPVAGARFSLVPAGLKVARFFTIPLGWDEAAADLFRTVETDPAGRFRTPEMAPGTYVWELHLPDGRLAHGEEFAVPPREAFVATRNADTAAPAILDLGELSFDSGVTVEVRVTDLDGRVLAGADVGASQGERPEDQVFFEATSDATGQAILGGLDPLSPLGIACSLPGYRWRRSEYTAPPATHLCELEPLGAIEGIVVDEAAQPLRGATVSIAGQAIDTTTSAEGRFRMSPLTAGGYRLRVAAAGYEIEERVVELAPGETAGLDPIRLLPGVEWSGRVVDAASGEPLPGARVVSRDPPGAVAESTAADGTFTAAGDGGEPLTIAVSAEGYGERTFEVDPETAAAAEEPVLFALDVGGFIHARMWDEEGEGPCGGCSIRIAGSGGAWTLVTDAEGTARSEPLSPGRYEAGPVDLRSYGSVITRRGGHDIRSVAVLSGQVTEVSFGEPRRRTTVVIGPSAPAGWAVSVIDSDGDRQFTPLDAEGTAEILLGRLPVIVMLTDGRGTSVRLAALAEDFDAEILHLTLPAASVHGRVAAAEPAAGRVEVVRTHDGEVVATTFTGTDGRFRFPFLDQGIYGLLVGGRVVRVFSLGSGEMRDLEEVPVTDLIGGGLPASH